LRRRRRPARRCVAAEDNYCGCGESAADVDPAYTVSDGHFGCKPGYNALSPVFSEVAWCYVANGIECPASFRGGDPDAPAIRQCAGFASDFGGEVLQPNDNCASAAYCELPTARALLAGWASTSLLARFGPTLDRIEADPVDNSSGPVGHRAGRWTILLPELPGADLDPEAATTDGGYFYAGEIFEGTSWNALDGGAVGVTIPSCTTSGVAFPPGGNAATDFILSCNCHGDCLSNTRFGDGVRFRRGGELSGQLRYWFFTREAIVLIHDE